MKFFRILQSKIWVLPIVITLTGFLILNVTINKNLVQFHADEFYWIQTGRILPYISQGKFSSLYWREHMGFTNFNGAKWIYAIGLSLLGHSDFERIGVPPETYYKWNSFEGNVFPPDHELFAILKHGRIISALMASIALGLLFILAFYITQNVFSSLFSVLLLVFHPIFQTISLHAFADSTFIVGQLAIYICLFKFIHSSDSWKKIFPFMIIGMILGLTISTKINAYMFFPVVLSILVYKNFKAQFTTFETVIRIIIVCISMSVIFVLLNPNLFFYKSYTLPMMMNDRIQITKMHMEYFRSIDPNHVLDTIPSRIRSLSTHIFSTPIAIGLSFTFLNIFISKKRMYKQTLLPTLFLHAIYIFVALLLYVAFDEERYFLPLLPFICILASVWWEALFHPSDTNGRN